MRKKLTALLILLLPYSLMAQNSRNALQNIFFFSPFKLVDPVNPGVEISYERSNSFKWSTHIAATYGLQITGVDRNISGYRLQVEQKYFNRTTTSKRQYLSAGLSYGETNLQEKASFYDDVNQISLSDTFSISRKNTSLNIKVGRQFSTTHLVFDFAIGAGLKYRNVQHNDKNIPYESRHYNIIHAANDERKEITFNLPATFKIGYRF